MIDAHNRGRVCFVTLFCVAVVLSLPIAGQTDTPVSVEDHPERQETVYQIAERSCEIEWTVSHSQVNRGVIQQRGACTLALGQQAPLIAKLLEAVIREAGGRDTPHTLYLGRLAPFPGLSARLAVLAARSSQWDAQRGQAKNGRNNEIVKHLARQDHFYQEWQDAFRRAGLQIEVSSVEKVLVSKAGKLSFYRELQGQSVPAADQVPYDCQIWLAITRVETRHN